MTEHNLTALRFAFLGAGNMASAMIRGLLAHGVPSSHIHVVAPSEGSRHRMSTSYGVHVQSNPDAAFGNCDLVILALKPQQIQVAASDLIPVLGKGLIFSLLAGTRLKHLQTLFGTMRIVRAMPNTPALIGCGMTGLAAPMAMGSDDRAFASALASAVGQCLWVDDEAQLDAVTALSGSGPAYLLYLIEAMEEASVSLGLTAEQGRLLATETFLGTLHLAQASEQSTHALREQVTSKGGTTAAAFRVLAERHTKDGLVAAVMAAAARSSELGQQSF